MFESIAKDPKNLESSQKIYYLITKSRTTKLSHYGQQLGRAPVNKLFERSR